MTSLNPNALRHICASSREAFTAQEYIDGNDYVLVLERDPEGVFREVAAIGPAEAARLQSEEQDNDKARSVQQLI